MDNDLASLRLWLLCSIAIDCSLQCSRPRESQESNGVTVDTRAQRWQDFLAPEIDHFGNVGAEGNADRNLRESIAGRQRKKLRDPLAALRRRAGDDQTIDGFVRCERRSIVDAAILRVR